METVPRNPQLLIGTACNAIEADFVNAHRHVVRHFRRGFVAPVDDHLRRARTWPNHVLAVFNVLRGKQQC